LLCSRWPAPQFATAGHQQFQHVTVQKWHYASRWAVSCSLHAAVTSAVTGQGTYLALFLPTRRAYRRAGGRERKRNLFFSPIFSCSANKARPSKGENAQHGEREGEETWIVEKAHTGLPGGDGHSTHDGGDCPSSASRLTTSKSAMSATGSRMR